MSILTVGGGSGVQGHLVLFLVRYLVQVQQISITITDNTILGSSVKVKVIVNNNY